MKALILSLVVMTSVNAFAEQSQKQTKTGELFCSLGFLGDAHVKKTVDILQNEDGTGGVAKVSVKANGVTCAASGFAKFGGKEVNLRLTTKSGETIKTDIEGDKGRGMLFYGKGKAEAICACAVKLEGEKW